MKQEESERRKSEEKARREQIFRQYIEKKEEDEEGVPRKREEKAKQKPRPKSMFVRAGPGANLDEGLENSASTEDLSARNLTVPSSRGSNSAACKSMGFSTCFLSYIGFMFFWKYFQELSKHFQDCSRKAARIRLYVGVCLVELLFAFTGIGSF